MWSVQRRVKPKLNVTVILVVTLFRTSWRIHEILWKAGGHGGHVRLISFLSHPGSHRSALKCQKVHGLHLVTAELGGSPRFLGFALGSLR